MRFIIVATIFCALVALAAAKPWSEVCPSLVGAKPVCTTRVVSFGTERIQFFLSFLSECNLEQFNKENPTTQYTALAAPGKTCEDYNIVDPFYVIRP